MMELVWNMVIKDKYSNNVPISSIMETKASCYNNFINYIVCNLFTRNYKIIEGKDDIVFNTIITDTDIVETYKFTNNTDTITVNIKIIGNTHYELFTNNPMYADVIINIDNMSFDSFYTCEDYLFKLICNLNIAK